MKQDLVPSPCATFSIVVIVLCSFAGTLQAQSNLVANGSFEAGPDGQGQFTAWNWLLNPQVGV